MKSRFHGKTEIPSPPIVGDGRVQPLRVKVINNNKSYEKDFYTDDHGAVRNFSLRAGTGEVYLPGGGAQWK